MLPAEGHGAICIGRLGPDTPQRRDNTLRPLLRLYDEHYARVQTDHEASGMRVARYGSTEMLGRLVNERGIEPPCASRNAPCLQPAWADRM